MSHAAVNCAVTDLIGMTRDLVFSLSGPPLQPFIASWPRAHGRSSSQAGAASPSSPPPPLPALRWLHDIEKDAPGDTREFAALTAALCRAAPSLTWRQTYTIDDLGAEFLRNYAYTEVVGPGAALLASEQLACGFLLLGSGTFYPRHRHEAEEIYIPLSGTAQWQQGDAFWRERRPGTIIHHASEEPHAMRTHERPLLALYLWRSANLNQKARLEGVA